MKQWRLLTPLPTASGAMRAHCQICLFAVLMFSPGDWSAQNASAMESLDYYIVWAFYSWAVFKI